MESTDNQVLKPDEPSQMSDDQGTPNSQKDISDDEDRNGLPSPMLESGDTPETTQDDNSEEIRPDLPIQAPSEEKSGMSGAKDTTDKSNQGKTTSKDEARPDKDTTAAQKQLSSSTINEPSSQKDRAEPRGSKEADYNGNKEPLDDPDNASEDKDPSHSFQWIIKVDTISLCDNISSKLNMCGEGEMIMVDTVILNTIQVIIQDIFKHGNFKLERMIDDGRHYINTITPLTKWSRLMATYLKRKRAFSTLAIY